MSDTACQGCGAGLGKRHEPDCPTRLQVGRFPAFSPKRDLPVAVCFNCHKTPDELYEYSQEATQSSLSPNEYVWAEEGTLNTENGHFCCTDCYIKIGMPSGSGANRWVAP